MTSSWRGGLSISMGLPEDSLKDMSFVEEVAVEEESLVEAEMGVKKLLAFVVAGVGVRKGLSETGVTLEKAEVVVGVGLEGGDSRGWVEAGTGVGAGAETETGDGMLLERRRVGGEVGEAWGLVDFKVDWKKAGVGLGGVFFLARRILLGVEEELTVLVGQLLGVGEECWFLPMIGT